MPSDRQTAETQQHTDAPQTRQQCLQLLRGDTIRAATKPLRQYLSGARDARSLDREDWLRPLYLCGGKVALQLQTARWGTTTLDAYLTVTSSDTIWLVSVMGAGGPSVASPVTAMTMLTTAGSVDVIPTQNTPLAEVIE